MKIVLLYLGRKGAGPQYSIEYARALLDKGIDVYAIISSYSENLKDWIALKNNYSEEHFALKKVPTYTSIRSFICNSFNVYIYVSIITSIRKYSPALVLSTLFHPWHNIIFLFLKKKFKRMKIVHDVKLHTGEDSFIRRIFNYIEIKNSDLYITLTETSKQELIKRGIPKGKICVIPHANFACYVKNNILVKSESIHNRIAFIGRINKYKGLDVLLNAFDEIHKKMPQLKLLIAGDGNCECYKDQFYKNKESLELNLKWIADDEFAAIIENVDIVVLPYIEATQSGIIPLAFAFGKTVVATNVGGIPEQIPQGTGIIIPSNDSVALEKVILHLYDNPDIIKTMSQAAFDYARTELSWVRSVELLMDFCKQYRC